MGRRHVYLTKHKARVIYLHLQFDLAEAGWFPHLIFKIKIIESEIANSALVTQCTEKYYS